MKTMENKIKEFLDENLFFSSDEEFAEKLTEKTGVKCRCYDSGIDDGIDDENCEDEYLIYSSFEFQSANLSLTIYYGDQTNKITDYRII